MIAPNTTNGTTGLPTTPHNSKTCGTCGHPWTTHLDTDATESIDYGERGVRNIRIRPVFEAGTCCLRVDWRGNRVHEVKHRKGAWCRCTAHLQGEERIAVEARLRELDIKFARWDIPYNPGLTIEDLISVSAQCREARWNERVRRNARPRTRKAAAAAPATTD